MRCIPIAVVTFPLIKQAKGPIRRLPGARRPAWKGIPHSTVLAMIRERGRPLKCRNATSASRESALHPDLSGAPRTLEWSLKQTSSSALEIPLVAALGLFLISAFQISTFPSPFLFSTSVLSPLEGLLKAYQLADQGVVARVGIATLLPEQAIELPFRLREGTGNHPCDQSGATQPGPGHAHQTGGDDTPSGPIIRESFPQECLSGKPLKEVAHKHRKQKSTDQMLKD